tara:strand:- start:774 stop:1049 length:276 start_codon:yes stop_codon:yes gene_type:complete
LVTKYRSIKLILLTTFSGCLLGTLLNNLCRSIIPENTVVSGLFKSQTITILPEGSIIDLGILKTGFSFSFDIGFLSILGIFIAWYFLRYFR